MIQGYEWIGLLIFTFLAIAPVLPAAVFGRRLFRKTDVAARRRNARRFAVAAVLAAGIYTVVVIDAFLVEPNWPQVSRFALTAPIDEPLRILHVSDLHIEPDSAPRYAWLVEQAAELAPDLILVTGDTHQLGNRDPATLAPILDGLQAPLGVFACVGYDNVPVLRQASPHIRFLENDAVLIEHGADRIGLAGICPVVGREKVYAAIEDADYRIVINHTPDLADEAAGHGADLYLCGHTHGGQVRIPLWGAIITNTESGKQYEAGRYQNGGTCIYTSRGFGLEPRPAPQVRFLCRPEVTVITVRPNS